METKTTRPQQLVTVDPTHSGTDKTARQWPADWPKKPEVLTLVGAHEQWLAQPVTLKARKLLQDQIRTYSLKAASMATNPAYTSEAVRCQMAQVNALVEMEKTIYDTEKYVHAVTGA